MHKGGGGEIDHNFALLITPYALLKYSYQYLKIGRMLLLLCVKHNH